jgi:hypothetical protein
MTVSVSNGVEENIDSLLLDESRHDSYNRYAGICPPDSVE